MTDTRKAWVAFDATGFPIGFATYTAGMDTIAKAGREFPRAVRIELLDTADWKAQLAIHGGAR